MQAENRVVAEPSMGRWSNVERSLRWRGETSLEVFLQKGFNFSPKRVLIWAERPDISCFLFFIIIVFFLTRVIPTSLAPISTALEENMNIKQFFHIL